MAGVYTARKDFDNALKSLDEAVNLSPNNVQVLFLRGQIYTHLKKNKLALNDLKRANDLAPNNKSVLKLLEKARSIPE